MEEFNIDISLENVITSDSSSFEISTGMYQIAIKQARLKLAYSSSAKALALTCDICKVIDSDGVARDIKATQEIDIWFLNRNNEPIEFGVNKIGSLLYLCGLPMKISSDSFVDSSVTFREYSEESGQYEEVTKQGSVLKGLAGKKVFAIIAVKDEEYNGKMLKKYDLNSFYNDSLKSVSEIKEKAAEAKRWKHRLEYLLKQENSAGTQKTAVTQNTTTETYTSPYSNLAVESSSGTGGFEISDEEIPF